MIVINTDGGARGNPGPSGAGVVCVKDGHEVFTLKKFLGHHTNNWAEYEALILALEEAHRRGLSGQRLDVRMDSELIVKQMRGEYRVKDQELKVKHLRVSELLARHFPDTTFVHVPRSENKVADRLVNEAIDEAAV